MKAKKWRNIPNLFISWYRFFPCRNHCIKVLHQIRYWDTKKCVYSDQDFSHFYYMYVYNLIRNCKSRVENIHLSKGQKNILMPKDVVIQIGIAWKFYEDNLHLLSGGTCTVFVNIHISCILITYLMKKYCIGVSEIKKGIIENL